MDGIFFVTKQTLIRCSASAQLDHVVQNFVSLTLSLSPQFVNCILTSKANALLFLLKKCENPLQCEGFSCCFFFFQQKITVFVILPFKFQMVN